MGIKKKYPPITCECQEIIKTSFHFLKHLITQYHIKQITESNENILSLK